MNHRKSPALLIIGIAGVLFSAILLQAQEFNAFLSRIYALPIAEKQALADSFYNAHPALPLIENETQVYFLYRGTANSVVLAGDANGWSTSADHLNLIYGTNLWYAGRQYENDARLDYKFVINGSQWILDPRNPHTVLGGFGPNSELQMPRYVAPDEITYRPEIPHGSFFDTTFYSVVLGNSRQVRIYLPPNYASSGDTCAVVLFHDGLEYVTLAYANNVFDYLIWQKKLDPLIGVFIPPVNRTAEYAGNQQVQFSDFIVNEVMVWVDRKYRTTTNPAKRVVAGASNGGNIALWMGINYPHVFGRVAAFSSNVQTSIATRLSNDPVLALKFYLDIGTYDLSILIPLVHNLQTILAQKGYEYCFREFHDGHSWGNWRGHIDDALLYLLPESAVRVNPQNPLPRKPTVIWNYPNPFNQSTTITFVLPLTGRVRLTIHDLTGRIVEELGNGALPAGAHAVQWSATNLPSGVYFCEISGPGITQRHKMLLVR